MTAATHRMERCSCCGQPVVRAVARAKLHAALPIAQRALREIAVHLEGCPDDCWRFFEGIWRDTFDAPRNAHQLAHNLAIVPQTLASRFHRRRLPSPKRYLLWARLVRAAALLEEGHTFHSASLELNEASHQSFTRALRREWGIGSTELRGLGSDAALERYINTLVRPYAASLRSLQPLAVDVEEHERRTGRERVA